MGKLIPSWDDVQKDPKELESFRDLLKTFGSKHLPQKGAIDFFSIKFKNESDAQKYENLTIFDALRMFYPKLEKDEYGNVIENRVQEVINAVKAYMEKDPDYKVEKVATAINAIDRVAEQLQRTTNIDNEYKGELTELDIKEMKSEVLKDAKLSFDTAITSLKQLNIIQEAMKPVFSNANKTQRADKDGKKENGKNKKKESYEIKRFYGLKK